MYLGFAYCVNGTWATSSWPSLMERERVTHHDVEFYEQYGSTSGYPASMLGELRPLDDEFEIPIPSSDMALLNAQDHFWYDSRNMGASAITSIGYGFVAAAIAKITQGRIMSDDGAFDIRHNGETAEQFLHWWGDEQLAFYGTSRFYAY